MRTFIFAIVLSFIFLFSSCKDTKGTKISGKVENAANMSIFLDIVGLNNSNEVLLTEKIDSDGEFKLPLPDGIKPGIYRLRIGTKAIEMVMDGTEKEVTVAADLSTIEKAQYTVKGSKLTEEYNGLLQKLMSNTIDANTLKSITLNPKTDPLVAFMLATRIYNFREDFADIHVDVAQKLNAKYPNISFGADYNMIAGELQKQMARKMATQKIQVGMEAPNISLNDPNGKPINLTDYKGKVVLLDFWASWCRPCRQANPEVVRVYKQYTAKGFEVLSVSLDGVDSRSRAAMSDQPSQLKMNEDRSREMWLSAIQQDGLTWKGHMSDLMKWDSKAAATYGVTSIPKTFLIDRSGKIAAVDPRFNLEEAVKAAL